MAEHCKNCEHADLLAKLDQIIEARRDEPGALMPVLQAAQEIYGHVPLNVQKHIAEKLGVTLSEVYGVATFYSQFALEPKGKYIISVCMGTACYVKGSQAVLDKLSEVLGVKPGETTPDGKFTLSGTRCLGACGLAPVMTINEDVHGRLTADAIPGILAKYQEG
ncbi:MAG: NADH-quinone oxidoreductase subunit NuoE [Christensenellales bacterium]|jgi:NADH-quinone oxidoreductase E subunit